MKNCKNSMIFILITILAIFSLIFETGCKRKHRHRHTNQPLLKIVRPGLDFLGTTGKTQIFEAQAVNLNAPVSWEINSVDQGTGSQLSVVLSEGEYFVVARASGLEDKIKIRVNSNTKYLITGGTTSNHDVYIVDEAFNIYNATRTLDSSETSVDVSPNGELIAYTKFTQPSNYKIFLANNDGSNPQEIGFGKNPRFLSDNQWIVYLAINSGEIRQVNVSNFNFLNTLLASGVECLGNTTLCWTTFSGPIPAKSLPNSLFFSGREVNVTANQRVILKLDAPTSSVTTTNQPSTYDFAPTDFFADRQILTNAASRTNGNSFSQVAIVDTVNGTLTTVSPSGDANNEYSSGAFSVDGLKVIYVNKRPTANHELRVKTLSTSAEKSLSFGDIQKIGEARFIP